MRICSGRCRFGRDHGTGKFDLGRMYEHIPPFVLSRPQAISKDSGRIESFDTPCGLLRTNGPLLRPIKEIRPVRRIEACPEPVEACPEPVEGGSVSEGSVSTD